MSFSRVLPLLLTIAAAMLVLFAVSRPVSRAMLYPGSPLGFPAAERLKASFPAARLVSYGAVGGPRLAGAVFPPPSERSPVAVYFHGNAESAALNLPLAQALHDAGIGLFLAEYRGFGGSEGSPTEDGLYADGEAAVEAVLASGVPPERLILVGRSLGSGVAVELALRRPPALLVLVSAYTSVVDMGRLLVGPLAPLLVADRFDSLAKLPRVKSPVVLVHGTRDEVVPVGMGRRLAKARPDARYVEVPEASHNDFSGLNELLAREILARFPSAAGSH